MEQKTMPNKKESSPKLENVVNKEEKKVSEEAKQHQKPNAAMYLMGELMKSVRETFVENPEDPTYQLVRRVIPDLMKNGDSYVSDIITEGVIISAYRFVSNLSGKKV